MSNPGSLLAKSIEDTLRKAAERQRPEVNLTNGIDPLLWDVCGIRPDGNEIQIFADDSSPLARAYGDLKRRERLGEQREDPITELLKRSELDFLRMNESEREQLTKAREAESLVKAADPMPGYVVEAIADNPEFTLLRRNRTTIASGSSLTKGAGTYAQRVATWNAAIAAGVNPHEALEKLGQDSGDDGRRNSGPRDEHGVEHMRHEHARHAFSNAGEHHDWDQFHRELRELVPGITPDEIEEAVRAAMAECQAAGGVGGHHARNV